MQGRDIIANWDVMTEQMEEKKLLGSKQIAYDSCAARVTQKTKVA